jgi:hypothetical protein
MQYIQDKCLIDFVRNEKKRNTNVGQSDVNMSPLALLCSRMPLVHGGFIAHLEVSGLLFVK